MSRALLAIKVLWSGRTELAIPYRTNLGPVARAGAETPGRSDFDGDLMACPLHKLCPEDSMQCNAMEVRCAATAC